MRLVALKQGQADKADLLRCERSDGSVTSVTMPRQGILPHDLIHFVVESTLGYTGGFLGEVAQGADIAFAMQMSHDVTGAAPSPQLAYAESIVESLQAQLWSGAFDADMFAAGLDGACAMRGCAAPAISSASAEALFNAVIALGERWRQTPPYGSLALTL